MVQGRVCGDNLTAPTLLSPLLGFRFCLPETQVFTERLIFLRKVTTSLHNLVSGAETGRGILYITILSNTGFSKDCSFVLCILARMNGFIAVGRVPALSKTSFHDQLESFLYA